jgi:N-acetyl-beta-hexosaminidase
MVRVLQVSVAQSITLAAAAIMLLAACAPMGGEKSGSGAGAVLVPAPLRVEEGTGTFRVTSGMNVSANGDGIARYFVELMERSRGIRLEGRAADNAPIHFAIDPAAGTENPESYEVRITSRGILVSAREPRGLFYGAVTLWQLLTPESTRTEFIDVPAVHIFDAPRFAWRGLLLDSARHYQSPEFIERFIDVMALHKLNVLHWHLTDDQAWRLEIKKYPKLTNVGAWRVPAGAAPAADIDEITGKPRLYGGYYSQETVRRLVAYAAARNITIVPEIEMPGHATATVVAYPELASVDQVPSVIPADWGIYPYLYNVDEPTFTFLQDVLTEVMELFPSTYIHVGGDEAVKNQWQASPRVQSRMRELGVENEQKLQSYFVQRMEKFLDAHGRRLIGWDEILEGGLGPKSTVMSWRGIDGALAAAASGHDAVLSPWPILYFDNRQSTLASEPPGRGRVVSTAEVYKFNPLPAALLAEQHKHILGVQGNIWTEHIRTEDRVFHMTYPRAAAVAEVGWSAPAQISWMDFSRRMQAQLERYAMLEIPHASLDSPAPPPVNARVRKSQELQLCSDNLVLSLEDDAPVAGQRAVFLVDIMNPCWIFRGANLSRAVSLTAAVGQVPFNFQIGEDVHKIPLLKPRTPEGELEVRVDGCQGETIAVLPLAPAVANNEVTTLPAASVPAREGKHDLCFMFTRSSVDPIWAIDSVQLSE